MERTAGKAITPFDLANFPALSNGEGQISVVRFSEIPLHPDCRWDSEYLCFEPYKNKNVEYIPIGDILLSSQYGLSLEMNEDKLGIPIYRMNEIDNMVCKQETLKYAQISQEEINTYQLNDRDVLFNRTNSQTFVGRTGIFRDFSQRARVFASYLIRIIPDTNKILPEYLVTFLNTKYGTQDVKRRARISINQSNVSAEELKQVEIPLFTKLQIVVSKAFEIALEKNQVSKQCYQQAQDLLLTELGLKDWKPKHQLSFIKDYSDTVLNNRIDAEYYQPKYDEIIDTIDEYKGGWDRLESFVEIKKSIEVGSEEYLNEGIPFIRVGNLSPFEISEEKYIPETLYKELTPNEENVPFEKSRNHQPQQHEILLSKDGTPGIAHFLQEKPQNMIVSGGILRLKNKTEEINNECLTLMLNSILVQEQINRDVGGSVILHWRPDQVKETIIPILCDSKQLEIQRKITESFELRKRSKLLLESAKRAVEMAIEQDEQQAMDWLEEQLKTAGAFSEEK